MPGTPMHAPSDHGTSRRSRMLSPLSTVISDASRQGRASDGHSDVLSERLPTCRNNSCLRSVSNTVTRVVTSLRHRQRGVWLTGPIAFARSHGAPELPAYLLSRSC